MNISERKAIDLLVSEFWRLGFFTVSRRLGTYLPEPEDIGKFKVDVIGRQKEKYALGITLRKEDVFNPDIIEKINYLASRKTRFSDKPILLLIGVPDIYFKQVKELLLSVDEKVKRNIKFIRILEEDFESRSSNRHTQQMIFS
ncbi:MAG: hypothetical protein A2W30_04065 [Ignavibacteria bacterium RBG_16_36_9]|jgi:hypothetical protein|nr:MAG: hypothetical protein A2W30_04065 [Ignavibacteria bacterium RBG_16_36_9]